MFTSKSSRGTLVVVSQLIDLAILLPPVLVDLKYHDGLCALSSPSIRMGGGCRLKQFH